MQHEVFRYEVLVCVTLLNEKFTFLERLYGYFLTRRKKDERKMTLFRCQSDRVLQ